MTLEELAQGCESLIVEKTGIKVKTYVSKPEEENVNLLAIRFHRSGGEAALDGTGATGPVVSLVEKFDFSVTAATTQATRELFVLVCSALLAVSENQVTLGSFEWVEKTLGGRCPKIQSSFQMTESSSPLDPERRYPVLLVTHDEELVASQDWSA